MPLSKTGAEMLFEVFSHGMSGPTLVTSNLPFAEWTEVLGSERLTGALLDRLTHHVHILEMNGESYRLKNSGKRTSLASRQLQDAGWFGGGFRSALSAPPYGRRRAPLQPPQTSESPPEQLSVVPFCSAPVETLHSALDTFPRLPVP